MCIYSSIKSKQKLIIHANLSAQQRRADASDSNSCRAINFLISHHLKIYIILTNQIQDQRNISNRRKRFEQLELTASDCFLYVQPVAIEKTVL